MISFFLRLYFIDQLQNLKLFTIILKIHTL